MNVQHTRRIRRVSLGSAFKVGVVLGAMTALLAGVPVLLLLVTLFSWMLPAIASYSYGYSSAGDSSTILITGLIGLTFYITASMLAGGIVGAIDAIIYNIVAGMTGGLEVEVS